ncbi:hypothetical protein MMC27_003267 [Xylographa pallens]|nr:hypothetical protein [Xylographa pallens]
MIALKAQAEEAQAVIDAHVKKIQEAWEEEARIDVKARIEAYFAFKQERVHQKAEKRIEKEVQRRLLEKSGGSSGGT